MPVFEVTEDAAPIVRTVDEVFRAFVTEISAVVGDPVLPVTCVKRLRDLMWTTVWFIDGKNNNLHVTVQGRSTVRVEIQSSQDPTTITFFMRSEDRLGEMLHRFAPDHWKART